MKRLTTCFFALLCIAGFFSGCLRDDCTSTRTYVRYDPVYKSLADCRAGLSVQAPRDMVHPGKIYAFDKYLFINEIKEGIHVVDNTDPSSPKKIAFWSIPGNLDIAIQDQRLYADQYMDLLTIDISDILHPQLLFRTENAFPTFPMDAQNNVLVDYKQTDVTETISCNDNRWNNNWYWESGDVLFVYNGQFNLSGPIRKDSGIPANIGVAGSYACFGLYQNYLYTMNRYSLRVWELSASAPADLGNVYGGENLETIFPWKDKLFLGAQSGVFIFNNSDPKRPVLEDQFNHASGCDPVVCDDKYAYVTIHDGNICNNGITNQLDIIGIENLPSSELLKSYLMEHPFGLAVTNNHLFVCDDGLKIYDKTNPLELKELSHLKGLAAHDVIAFSDTHLLLIGDDGFYQYDVSDPASPKQLSLLPVNK